MRQFFMFIAKFSLIRAVFGCVDKNRTLCYNFTEGKR